MELCPATVPQYFIPGNRDIVNVKFKDEALTGFEMHVRVRSVFRLTVDSLWTIDYGDFPEHKQMPKIFHSALIFRKFFFIYRQTGQV